jgi:hypothetical protein
MLNFMVFPQFYSSTSGNVADEIINDYLVSKHIDYHCLDNLNNLSLE